MEKTFRAAAWNLQKKREKVALTAIDGKSFP